MTTFKSPLLAPHTAIDPALLKTQYGLDSDAWRANLTTNCEVRSLILFLG